MTIYEYLKIQYNNYSIFSPDIESILKNDYDGLIDTIVRESIKYTYIPKIKNLLKLSI